MKFIHTADWHLGRVYHGISLLDDQAYILEKFVALVRCEQPDVVLIAGDVYDRSVPPAEAVRLLDEILTRIVIDEKVPVILIAGNHDGPDRLGFGSRLLAEAGLTVRGVVTADVAPVVLADTHGEVAIYPLPYAEPATLRHALGDEEIHDHHAVLQRQLENIRCCHNPQHRSVVLAHAFVAGGAASDSERPLSVGGTGAVGADVFAGFNYVALGHLHRPQDITNGNIHYAGSLLKYSFAEADHGKSVSIVELDGDGKTQIRRIALAPRRDLRILNGTLESIIGAADKDPGRDDYILARLDDSGAILDAMNNLRSAYPNALSIERLQLAGNGHGLEAGNDHRKIDIIDLFQSFYREMSGTELASEATQMLQHEITAMNRAEREVTL